MERGQALVFALTGNYGKKGSGFVGFPWLDHDAIEGFVRGMFSVGDMMNKTALKVIGGMLLDTAALEARRLHRRDDRPRARPRRHRRGPDDLGALFWYVHGGLLEASEKLQEWDPYLKRPVREVLEESLEKELAERLAQAGQRPEDALRAWAATPCAASAATRCSSSTCGPS